MRPDPDGGPCSQPAGVRRFTSTGILFRPCSVKRFPAGAQRAPAPKEPAAHPAGPISGRRRSECSMGMSPGIRGAPLAGS